MGEPINLYIVIPCYNEEEVLYETCRQMRLLMSDMKEHGMVNNESRIVFVDDGSKDKTWGIIDELSDKYEEVAGVKLAANAGHQNALYGGLMTVKDDCDCAISIDADLQDDINVIPSMVEKFRNGADIVYGVRNKRDTDTFFKRTTAQGFYKIMSAMGVKTVYNHADFRLMSHRALEAFSQYPERNLFLRGIVPLLGYKTDSVFYDRKERFAGESKYPLKKMISFAFDGITSFSINPIRLISTVGALACLLAVIMGIYAIVEKIMGQTSTGWASIMCSVWFLGGMQMLSIGLIGEYIGKMYKEVKRRPRYIIETYKNSKKERQ